MKLPRLLACLALLPVAALAAPVTSTLSAVTVYLDRAVVTRTAGTDLPGGVTELVFDQLPASLNEQSLQVSGRGTAQATILDVRVQQAYVDFTPNARVKELEDQLRTLQKQTRALTDRAGGLKAQTGSLAKIENALFAPPTTDAPRPELAQLTGSLTYLAEQRAKIAAEQATLDEQQEDLQTKVTAVENQLKELRGTGGRSYKNVTVRVNAAQAGHLDLALSYAVPEATWTPSYDARMQRAERSVALGYFGLVRQNTGEDWKDVALTLSTARPSLGGAAPVLTAWNLDLWVPRPMAAAMVADSNDLQARAKSVRIEAGATMNMQRFTTNAPGPAPLEPVVVDADLATSTVEAGATSAVFKIATAASIPSDNSPQKVPITSVRLAAAPEYLTVPKRQAAAFLTSKVANSSDFPLLGGAMNVFLDGTFVATSPLRTVMPGEKFDLALGVDDGIGVKHQRVKKFTEDTGLTGSGKRVTYEYLLTVQNHKKSVERVIVVDQIPVSRNEKVVVKQLAPDARELKPTAEGALKWTLELQPGEKRELTVKFSVDYPNDVNVTGLE